MGRSSWRDELPLNLQVSLQPFEKWVTDFVGPIHPPGKQAGACYIITATKYLTRWVEAQPVKHCTSETSTKFGFLKLLMSDRSTHFLNETISALIEEFQVYHQKSTPYHPQANGTVEAFNKILENALMNIFNAWWNDWDVRVPMVLWAHITTCKNLTAQMPFQLVYGVEALMLMEYIYRVYTYRLSQEWQTMEP